MAIRRPAATSRIRESAGDRGKGRVRRHGAVSVPMTEGLQKKKDLGTGISRHHFSPPKWM